MDIPCLPLHVLIYLIPDVVDDQRGITANDPAFVLFLSFNLGEILLNDIDDEIRIIIGKFTDRIKKHTGKRVQGIVDFQNLGIDG